MKMFRLMKWIGFILFVMALAGCGGGDDGRENAGILHITTSSNIVADVVSQIGGDHIQQTVLFPLGADPHSYEPTPADLVAITQADLIFINGLGFEQASLVEQLSENAGRNTTVIPVSKGIAPLTLNADHTADPHVWFNPDYVRQQWVENITTALIVHDPAHSDDYRSRADAYTIQLKQLIVDVEAQLDAIPADKRLLVTNHDSFAYFSDKYGLTLVGTVIPASSTMAEPSAGNLTQLITSMEANNICTIFTEITVNDTLAQTVAAELSHCDQVRVLSLYTGSLGEVESGADNYIDMFQTNVDTIVEGLR